MIIWINGTFGVGKTMAAQGLQQRIDHICLILN
ncbi:AAA family ATPase [Exiguobacterium artemiae]|nr:AAA family ATPase [Exiguobacterium sibiricum]